MFRTIIVLIALMALLPASAQSTLGRLLSGELVNPADGVWAWYELEDAATGEKLYLRQAIVGVEGDGKKTHYWLELQVRPQVGFATTYKMLLRGPSASPSSIERIYFQTESEPAQKLEPSTLPQDTGAPAAPPEPVDQQTVDAPGGPILCNHYVLEGGTEIWLSDTVPPMGIVRLTSPEGELRLQSYGRGGKDAMTSLPTEEDKTLVRDFGAPAGETGAQPAAPTPTQDATGEPAMPADEAGPEPDAQEDAEQPKKKNFRGRIGKR